MTRSSAPSGLLLSFLRRRLLIPGRMRCRSGFLKRIFVINLVELRYLADPAG